MGRQTHCSRRPVVSNAGRPGRPASAPFRLACPVARSPVGGRAQRPLRGKDPAAPCPAAAVGAAGAHTADEEQAALRLYHPALLSTGAGRRAFLCEDSNTRALIPPLNLQVCNAEAPGRLPLLLRAGPGPRAAQAPCPARLSPHPSPPRSLPAPPLAPPPGAAGWPRPSAQCWRGEEPMGLPTERSAPLAPGSPLSFALTGLPPALSLQVCGRENNAWVLLLCSATPEATAAAWRRRH